MLLRRFHDAEPCRELPWFRDWLLGRARYWSSRARNLLPPADFAVIADLLAALGRLAIPPGCPCHLDFQPRNWLVSRAGSLAIIDFEHARIDLPARDFVRLHFRVWPQRPDLRDAFFDGYGRPLTDVEDELIRHLGALDVVTSLVRGNETRDPQLTAFGRSTLRQLCDER
jgi:aminoglycoside phosphotransferase (APT) family kinase protein